MEPHSCKAIAVIEDHVATRRFLVDNLAADGYRPLEARTADEGMTLIAQQMPDAAIVDLGLPDRDGLDLLRELRESQDCDPSLPVIILSGRAGELDRIRGFDRGCDDYVVKPFSYVELRGRLAALLRRSGTRQRPGRLRVGGLELDPRSRTARLDDRPLRLSKKEFALLRLLASEPTRVFTRAELLRDVWGFSAPVVTRTVDSHASRLRRKLEGGRERFVSNVWGVGYRLIDSDAER